MYFDSSIEFLKLMICRSNVNNRIADAFVVVSWHIVHVEPSIKMGLALPI